MKLFEEKKDCCGCGACAEICQAGAIHMVQDGEGFSYPKINKMKCKECGLCESVCPIKKYEKGNCNNLYYGAQAKDETVRYSSSSGGIFSVLAQYIFQNKGSVYGAGYDKQMKVVHKAAQDMEGLEELRRTKYVQSVMQGVYQKIKVQLEGDEWVLFCGTPCQAHALNLFLGRAYEKLVVVDLVCYGVPSPGVWQSYVKYLEHRHGGRMTNFSFRDKRNADSGHTCSYIVDGQEYAHSLHVDKFCKMYFTNYILRPSCHSCKFCNVERNSDFTIGDFWGIEKIRPKMDDGMGTSLVILHTDKAREIWDIVKDNLNWFECTKEEVLQPRLIEPTGIAGKRKQFMNLYKAMPFPVFMKMIFDEKGLKQNWR